MNTNERERELVCLHPLGFKDSTKNTHVFVFPKKWKRIFFTHVCLCLFRKKTHHRLRDVNDDAYFKEEEDEEDKEERTRVVGE